MGLANQERLDIEVVPPAHQWVYILQSMSFSCIDMSRVEGAFLLF